MRFIIILLTICVFSGFPSILTAQNPVIGSEWFASTSNIIKLNCQGFNHDIEIAWSKFGKLALSISDTNQNYVRLIYKQDSSKFAINQCTGQVYNGTEILAAFRLKMNSSSVFSYDQDFEERAYIPRQSRVKCHSTQFRNQNFVLDWANAVYSPVSRRTTIFGSFEGISNVDNSGENVFTCSGESTPEISYDNVRVTWEKISPPVIRLIPHTQIVTIDESTEVACEVIGNDPVEFIAWYRKELNFTLTPRTDNNIYFRNISIQDEGEYFCRAYNSAGWSALKKLVIETIPCS